ncbi:MAG: flagellar hook capping FlgD N-terminal domain-containing protein [Pseudomonadota bacterium]
MSNGIDAVSSAATLASSAPQTNSDAARERADEDFQSFLQLLTAQLQNQDPLSPVDSTQFVEQLASFSSVEQQIETNALLEQLVNAENLSGLDAATRWVGREVDAPSSEVRYADEPVTLRIPANGEAEPSELVVQSENGAIVRQIALRADQTSYELASTPDAPLPDGRYTVQINYLNDEGETTAGAPVVSGRVVEAQLIDGALRLITETGAAIDPDAVLAVREAAPRVAAVTPLTDGLDDDGTQPEATGEERLNALTGDGEN